MEALLNPRDVEALLLFMEHGNTIEAAKAMKISRNNVRNRLLRVRQILNANSTAQAYWILTNPEKAGWVE